jgi:tellurite methyltransferase
LFCRLASSIGMEQQMKLIAGRRCLLRDGSERYLVDETFLDKLTEELGGQLIDPLKTTVVQNQRCMTTWIVRKTPELQTCFAPLEQGVFIDRSTT